MARVLLADDEPAILNALRRMLPSPWEAVTAGNAGDAAHLLDGPAFDVVITDFDMPDHNGAWLLHRASEKQPHALRVLMSGAQPPQLVADIESGLVQKWMPKPFSASDVCACLRLADGIR
jgi:DNA-binding NtrC family response regulator